MGLPSFPVVLPVLNEFLIKLGMPLNIIPKKNQEFFYGITRQTMELRKTDKDQVFLALYAFNKLFLDIFNKNFKVTHFKRIRQFTTRSAAEMIYKCTILPVLEYGYFILDQGVAYINKTLQKIQNFCLLIVNN